MTLEPVTPGELVLDQYNRLFLNGWMINSVVIPYRHLLVCLGRRCMRDAPHYYVISEDRILAGRDKLGLRGRLLHLGYVRYVQQVHQALLRPLGLLLLGGALYYKLEPLIGVYAGSCPN